MCDQSLQRFHVICNELSHTLIEAREIPVQRLRPCAQALLRKGYRFFFYYGWNAFILKAVPFLLRYDRKRDRRNFIKCNWSLPLQP